jgi:hypothetical protein
MTGRQLNPISPTPMTRDQLDGTTAWSDEAGLPGKPRLPAWTVVQEDQATFDISVLWDTGDLDEPIGAALGHARAFFGSTMMGGTVHATLDSAADAVTRRCGSAAGR